MAEKTYNILNHTTSPVVITINRYDSIIIEKGSDDSPTAYPLTENEILYANNTTNAFKSGILRFESEHEAELYELCRIRDWKNIMTNKQIEDIFIDFKLDKFKEVLKISNASYFNRIYGVFIGLRNAGLSIPKNVEQAMSLRYKELANGTKTTKIILTPSKKEEDSQSQQIKRQKKEIDELKAQIEEFKKMFLQTNSNGVKTNEEGSKQKRTSRSTNKTSTK